MRIKQPVIGVIGHTGTVGKAVYGYFQRRGFIVYGLSKNSKQPELTSYNLLNSQCDFTFVCVPTPYDFKKQQPDFSILEQVLGELGPQKVVILKSTLLPGMTDELQKRFPKLKLLFNPEFLSRTTASSDFEHPDRQFVGYTSRTKQLARAILELLPPAPYAKVLPVTEAELIKYAHNVFGAMAVIFSNHLYDITQHLGVDYQRVIRGFAASKFITEGILRYTTIFHNNKRGYGGPCFPKDVNSFLFFAQEAGIDVELILATRLANERILSQQGLTEDESTHY